MNIAAQSFSNERAIYFFNFSVPLISELVTNKSESSTYRGEVTSLILQTFLTTG